MAFKDSIELTATLPPFQGSFENDVPFPKDGCVVKCNKGPVGKIVMIIFPQKVHQGLERAPRIIYDGMQQYHRVILKNIHILLMEEILHQLIFCLSHYLQDFVHPRWCRISSINSISCTIEIERNHKIIVRCQDIDTFEPQKKTYYFP